MAKRSEFDVTIRKAQIEKYAQLPYTTVVERAEDQGVYYVARVLELDGLIMTGDTPAEAVAELEAAKRDWIETNLELGNTMPLPLKSRKYSGQYRIRMEPSLHEALALLAEHEGISLNHLMVSKLAQAAGYGMVANQIVSLYDREEEEAKT